MQVAMPNQDQLDENDVIYRKLVDAIPDRAETKNVLLAISMLLASVIIEHSKGHEGRVRIASALTAKIMEACDCIPSCEELANGVEPRIQSETRH